MSSAVGRYKHGIAGYPLNWKTYVVSENKICIQFENVQCKTRIHNRECGDLKRTLNGGWYMPIDSHGTDIGFLAIGIPLELYPEMLDSLLEAFKENIEKFGDGNNIKNYLLEFANKILKTFNN